MGMKVATWNINGVKARLDTLLTWLGESRPDIVCLQEIKSVDEGFPLEAIESAGYNCAVHGQKGFNGVALLSRRPIEDVRRGLPGEGEGDQRRVIACQVEDLLMIDVYVVNGEEVGSAKYAYKLEWMKRLADYVATFDPKEKLIVAGDFNVTFDDRDVHDPEAWREKVLCSSLEREALRRVMAPGLHDAFRRFEEDAGHFTWWDFRTRGFERGLGLRIDHFLMSAPALDACTGVTIQKSYRGGEKPSDHAPVVADLS